MLISLIPTRVHGIIDYLMGLLLLAAPWLFHFADNRTATLVPVVLGAGAILYSLMTNYDLGVVKVIPMPVHLVIDLVAGILLAASPWLLGFAGRIAWPHVTAGMLEVGVVLLSASRGRVPVTSPDVSGGAPRGV